MIAVISNLRNSTILKNFSILTVSNALTQFLGIFVSIKIARSLNPLGFGIYNLLQLHLYTFTVIASFGLRDVIIRSIARNKESVQSVFRIVTRLRWAGFFLSMFIFIVYYSLYHHYDALLFGLVIISILSNIFFDLFESVAFGLEKMEFSGIINLASSIFWLSSVLLIPKSTFTLHLVFELFVFFSTAKCIAYLIILFDSRYIKAVYIEHTKKKEILKFAKDSFPYYYLALLTLLSNQIPLLFLEYRSGVAQIGFFNIASKLLMPINLVIDTALAAIFPNLSRLFVTNNKLFVRSVKLILILMSLFVVAGAFFITLFRQEFIQLLYGKEYINSSLVLSYQAWYVALYSIVCLIGTILSAINQQKTLGHMSIICTIIQVPILWYAAKFGAQYLSAAFLFITIISFIIHLYVIHKFLGKDLSPLIYVKIILIFSLGYIASSLVPVELFLPVKLGIFVLIFGVGVLYIIANYKHKLWLK